MADMKFIKRNTPTWKAAWEALRQKYGEVHVGWQYMGTVIKDDGTAEHQFRHRELPSKGGDREYFNTHTPLNGYDDYS